MKNMKKLLSIILILCVLAGALAFVGCEDLLSSVENGELNLPIGDRNEKTTTKPTEKPADKPSEIPTAPSASLESIPSYTGSAYVIINDNTPSFDKVTITTKAYETYSELDSLGRCGVTEACVGREIMPTEDRESISKVYPTGWVQNKYSTSLVDGGYIYNRAHLIGFQLTGENANKQNLITGTRYFNVEGMLPFENMVADYVRETGNHVMYRVTPMFAGDNLLATGVLMEAYSVEDSGEGVTFCVFVYNVQPGIDINYATGDNKLAE